MLHKNKFVIFALKKILFENMKYLKIILLLLTITSPVLAKAVSPGEVRFSHEQTDTAFITEILTEISSENYPTTSEKIIAVATKLIDTPYKNGTIEGEPEQLTVDFSAMDCTTFVENVLALVMTLEERRTSWHDFIYNLEKIRYRNGTINGYASRLHYISDWIIDNSHRGIMVEVTDRIASPAHQIKTLDFMTNNRDKYPALKDDEEFEKLKTAEIGYRSHKYPYIKSLQVKDIPLQDGDIVALTTKTQGLDVQHIGFIKNIDGVPHLLHASSAQGKVTVDPLSLADYLKRNRSVTGIRVIRLKD